MGQRDYVVHIRQLPERILSSLEVRYELSDFKTINSHFVVPK